MIWWNGKSSDDLHLYVERYPSRKLPERKTTFFSVAGRTGDHVLQQDAWSSYTQAYEIYISAEYRKLPNAMLDITAWLYGVNGYAKLEDSYDLDSYRMACFVGGQDIENKLNRFGRATIEFTCSPQRWIKSGERWIDFTSANGIDSAIDIVNPSGIPSKPYIEFQANGYLNIANFDSTSYYKNFTVNDASNIISADCENLTYVTTYDLVDPYTQACELPKLTLKTGKLFYDCDDLSYIKLQPRWFTL